MNVLTLFARNLLKGPVTDPYPFGPTTTADRFRGRIAFDAKSCEGCKLCERVCPSGAIRFSKDPGGLAFDCWHATCVFCGTCAFYCPTGSIKQTGEWALAHVQADKFKMVEHGLIPNQTCTECGATALDTAPMVSTVKPPLEGEELTKLRSLCPKCRAKFLRNRKAQLAGGK